MKCSTESTNDEQHDERSNGSESAWPGTSMLDSTDPPRSLFQDTVLVLVSATVGAIIMAAALILLN
ncbi:MAG: hypothetical protein JWQ87_2231 [Candidatus Sulfotelmatobacter sp.]|nr:hypothetical protein [Candidatus Sulfotelmatobacter sp.]